MPFFGLTDLRFSQHIALCLLAWGRACLLNACRFFFERSLCMIPSPLGTILSVLAIRDLRNASRFASLLGAAFAMLALAPQGMSVVLVSQPENVSLLPSRSGPYTVGLCNPNTVEYLYFAYRRLGPIWICRPRFSNGLFTSKLRFSPVSVAPSF